MPFRNAISLFTAAAESHYLQHGCMPKFIRMAPGALDRIAEVMQLTIDGEGDSRHANSPLGIRLVADPQLLSGSMLAGMELPIC